jgi:hypothetical protein
MKAKEAIEALKQGKRIMRVASDPPVNLCDHLDDDPSKRGFYQLCHQDKVMHLVPVSSCAAEVKSVRDLSLIEPMMQYAYLNYAEYEEPA